MPTGITYRLSVFLYSSISFFDYFHRSQSASNAVQNARRKAAEMARLVEGSLGSPLNIEQLGCEELPTHNVTETNSIKTQFTLWQQSCITMKSSVKILFELKSRK